MNPDIAYCAAELRRADPDRFAAAMSAPMPGRGDLLVLWAFANELARAPWVTAEPHIALMRLQWWRDALAEIHTGGIVRRHAVATPLAHVVRGHGLPSAALEAMIDGYESLIPGVGPMAQGDFLRATGVGLADLGWRVLTGEPAPEPVRALARCGAQARLWLAVPQVRAAGLVMPVEDGIADTPEAGYRGQAAFLVQGWAQQRSEVDRRSPGLPVLRAEFATPRLLHQVCRRPEAVATGLQPPSPLARQWYFLRCSWLGGF